ncbi:MAG TPA: RES domain-containing protein [Stellaceae bacterium]|nr:RES domain-containing protein [Stellaceae bacterium]
MTPLPPPLGPAELVAWRLDETRYAPIWDRGEGSYRVGGRWNSKGVRAVYCCLDPACAILEVAAHKGFKALDTVAHTLSALTITDASRVHVVDPSALPNSNWLAPGIPSAWQQTYGDGLLAAHPFVVIPSAVSTNSWNLIFVAANAGGAYAQRSQAAFALDTRLHPPPP